MDRNKAKLAKATPSRTKPFSSPGSEQIVPTNQNLESGPGGSSSTAQGLAPSPVAKSGMHTLVHDSVMALLPGAPKGLQAASQASPGTQKAPEPHDDSSAPYGQSIRRPASMGERQYCSMGERQYCAGSGMERSRLEPDTIFVSTRDTPPWGIIRGRLLGLTTASCSPRETEGRADGPLPRHRKWVPDPKSPGQLNDGPFPRHRKWVTVPQTRD